MSLVLCVIDALRGDGEGGLALREVGAVVDLGYAALAAALTEVDPRKGSLNN